MNQIEFAARMIAVVVLQVKDKVVEDDKSFTFGNLCINLLRCVTSLLCIVDFWSLDMAERELIPHSEDCLKQDHKEDEGDNVYLGQDFTVISK